MENLPLLARTEQMARNYLAHSLFRSDQTLNSAGKWLILTTPDRTEGAYTLLHRSRDQGFVMTPITQLADGSFVIERPTWPLVHQVHFPTLDKLSSAITNTGLSLQSRLPR